MTLCKFRPRRTYGEQYLVDEVDVRGLMKALEDRTLNAPEGVRIVYMGAHMAFNVMFRDYPDGFRDFDAWEPVHPHEREYWVDFMERFDEIVAEQFGEEKE